MQARKDGPAPPPAAAPMSAAPPPHRRAVPRRPTALLLVVPALAAACTTTRTLPPQVVVGGAPIVLRGDAASRTAFTPDRPAPGPDFECAPATSTGDGLRRLQGLFPTRTAPVASVTVVVDSTGRWFEISERCGLVRIPVLARAGSDSARARAIRDAEAAERFSTITLSRVPGLGAARNAGGGRADDGVGGAVDEIAALPALEGPVARAEAVIARCGR